MEALLKVLPFDNLKFVSLPVLIFVWAVNHEKTIQLSQKLDMFFKKVTLVGTPKTVKVCLTIFTGPQ